MLWIRIYSGFTGSAFEMHIPHLANNFGSDRLWIHSPAKTDSKPLPHYPFFQLALVYKWYLLYLAVVIFKIGSNGQSLLPVPGMQVIMTATSLKWKCRALTTLKIGGLSLYGLYLASDQSPWLFQIITDSKNMHRYPINKKNLHSAARSVQKILHFDWQKQIKTIISIRSMFVGILFLIDF